MPSRVIREGLLDSQRYWTVTMEARQLFVHLMLLADDFGLVSLAPVFIRRRCFDDAPSPVKIDKLLEQLADADLIRIYAADAAGAQARYAFIPRFGQRLRLMRCKHPMPPEALFRDDAEASEKFRVNKAKFETLSARRGQMSVACRPEVEVETNRREVESKTSAPPKIALEDPVLSAEHLAERLGIVRQPGEGKGSFHARVLAAKQRSSA